MNEEGTLLIALVIFLTFLNHLKNLNGSNIFNHSPLVDQNQSIDFS
jgi:hypothetical protein